MSHPEIKKLPVAEKHIEPSQFKDTLEDAEHLLKYAAEIGIEVDAHTRDAVLEARALSSTGWDEVTATHLLAALTKLAARLKPVTAGSLRASGNGESKATGRRYWIIAIVLAVLIIPYSLFSIVSSALSDSIRKDISAANDLAVKLTSELGASSQTAGTNPCAPSSDPPAGADSSATANQTAGVSRVDVITQLQSFASTIRAIDTRALQLNLYVLHEVNDPFASLRPTRTGPLDESAKKAAEENAKTLKATLQLPLPLPDNLARVAECRISVYQDVRYFGQSVVDEVAVWYNAFAVVVLPVLYALLGTCVYLVRTFEQETGNRTFTPSHADYHRFLIAGVAGAVVGFFSNFALSVGSSISPLAIAFLAGYAVDAFFSFLDGIMRASMKKSASEASSAPTAGGNP
jgi:hypothetical protein